MALLWSLTWRCSSPAEIKFCMKRERVFLDPCRLSKGLVPDANRINKQFPLYNKGNLLDISSLVVNARCFYKVAWVTMYLKNPIAYTPCSHILIRSLSRLILPWPFLCLPQPTWAHIPNTHDSVSEYICSLQVCMSWASLPWRCMRPSHVQVQHNCDYVVCHAPLGSWSLLPCDLQWILSQPWVALLRTGPSTV